MYKMWLLKYMFRKVWNFIAFHVTHLTINVLNSLDEIWSLFCLSLKCVLPIMCISLLQIKTSSEQTAQEAGHDGTRDAVITGSTNINKTPTDKLEFVITSENDISVI